MAPIDSRWFSGTDILPELFAENLAVASFGYPVNSTLGKNGWDGKTVIAVGLELSPDNRQVGLSLEFFRFVILEIFMKN